MPPNIEGTVQNALPYDQPNHNKKSVVFVQESELCQSTSRHQEIEDEVEDEGAVRITTRARISYELDRFSKNAMLIIRKSGNVDATMENLKSSFQRFRFEVEVIETNLLQTGKEIEDKLNTFFQQDFSQIGAVAVVYLTSTEFKSFEDFENASIDEYNLMKYFTYNQLPSLQGKPKIFISEAFFAPHSMLEYSTHLAPPFLDYTDMLTIQANKLYNFEGLRPIDLLCGKLNEMENNQDLMTKLYELDIQDRRVLLNKGLYLPITFNASLTKELRLEKPESSLSEDTVVCISATEIEGNLRQNKRVMHMTYAEIRDNYFYTQRLPVKE